MNQRKLAATAKEKEVVRRKLAVTDKQLAVSNEAVRNFLGLVAHDLRSPVAVIVGYAQALCENWDAFSEEGRWDAVTTIARRSQFLSRLVNDLFTLSSIESGGLNAQIEMVMLRDAIEECIESTDWDATNVSVSCSPDLAVLVDPLHLSRILVNYIQNAFNYGEPPVGVEATQVGDMVQIRVLDHGLGVPPEFVPRLFGKFSRVNATNKKGEKGTGLGLSIVRGLAEVYGGRTSYEPNIPSGAIFIVHLPTSERTIL